MGAFMLGKKMMEEGGPGVAQLFTMGKEQISSDSTTTTTTPAPTENTNREQNKQRMNRLREGK